MAKILLLDTNLLLFYLVLQVDLSLLKTFKRVSDFRGSDRQTLRDLTAEFSELMTAPHALTEVSNYIDQAKSYRLELVHALRTFVSDNEERYESARLMMERQEFEPLALTDTALLMLSGEATVATLDYQLHWRILQRGGKSVYFQYLRPQRAPSYRQ